jgi:predicted metal-dependent hydrolase
VTAQPDAPRQAAAHGAPSLETTRTASLPGGPLEYVLRRSPRARRLRVVIDPERGVVVTIPTRGAVRAAEAFLAEREGWVRRHLEIQRRAAAGLAARRPFGPDGRILYRGESHRLRLERAAPGTKRSRVLRIGGDELDEILLVLALHDRRPAAEVLEDWLRERAQAAIRSEIAAHASPLGVRPAAVAVRDARTRWGSATRTGRLSFSWRLILAPPAALETVVIHELAHLRVFGHGPRFWAVVASRRPDHRTWRKWLRDHTLELHAPFDADDAIVLGQLSFADQLAI